jgi:ABC-type transporter Mla subunit MlaD
MADRDPNGDEWSLRTLRVLVESNDKRTTELIAANDLRYQQRFLAQSEALTAAFLAQKSAVEAALTAADRAVIKAETASEKRFDAVNEFRQSLNDQSRLLMPRSECEQALRTMKEAVDKLESSVSQRRDITAGVKEGTRDSWATIIAVISLGATIIMGIFYIAHWSGK